MLCWQDILCRFTALCTDAVIVQDYAEFPDPVIKYILPHGKE